MSAPLEPGITAHANDALRAVRLLLAVIVGLVLATYRPATVSSSAMNLGLVLAVLAVSVLGLNAGSRLVNGSAGWAAIVVQTLDVIAITAAVILLDDPLGAEIWVLMVIPVVSAAVSSGAMAAFLSWALGFAGYLAGASLGFVTGGGSAALLIYRPGCLLAVAATVSILARWMREGWEIQNALTAETEARRSRLEAIEQASRSLRDSSPHEALMVCANQLIKLGFEAATIHRTGESPFIAIGDAGCVSGGSGPTVDPDGRPAVTIWTEDGCPKTHSASTLEPASATVVSGWSRQPVDDDQAEALATLVGHTSIAIEASSLLNRLRRAAENDPLTGLANRRSFERSLGRARDDGGPVTVAFIDLDDFKPVNDTHGHFAGDQVLTTIANRLRDAIGNTGVVGRYGGDEFIVLLPGLSLDVATRTATIARTATDHPIRLGNGLEVSVGLSLGLATARLPDEFATVVQRADKAAYEDKAARKARRTRRKSDTPPDRSGRLDKATPISDRPRS